MERYFLIGYMGAGKTTLGKIFAQHKGLTFIDLDHYIERKYQKTISQIFQEVGETGFRKIESALLKEVSEFENVVISTGGGAPCFFDNMEHMNLKGYTIYLKSSPTALIRRLNLSKSKRPLLKDKSENELFEFIANALSHREQYYNQAQIIYDVEELSSVDEADKFVKELLKKQE